MGTKNQTSITSDRRKQMPSRGRSKRTLILEAMKESALLGLSKDASQEDAEKAWFSYLIKTSLDAENKDSGLCTRLISERGWSALKPSSETVHFEFDPNAKPHEQASQVMDAASKGTIPPDLALAFVSGIKQLVEVEANTELKARIEKLEEMLNAGQSS